MTSRIGSTIIALLLAALVAGCATTPRQPVSIEDRAQAKWNALISGDIETAYSYTSPGYRKAVSLTQFTALQSRRTIAWTGAEVTGTKDCDEQVCKVGVAIDYEVTRGLAGISSRNPIASRQTVWEDWIRAENAWYYVPKQ